MLVLKHHFYQIDVIDWLKIKKFNNPAGNRDRKKNSKGYGYVLGVGGLDGDTPESAACQPMLIIQICEYVNSEKDARHDKNSFILFSIRHASEARPSRDHNATTLLNGTGHIQRLSRASDAHKKRLAWHEQYANDTRDAE